MREGTREFADAVDRHVTACPPDSPRRYCATCGDPLSPNAETDDCGRHGCPQGDFPCDEPDEHECGCNGKGCADCMNEDPDEEVAL
jgi:hypothetical protein